MKTNREHRTPVQALAALHESASLHAVTGPSLRPGGFLLTERGLSQCGFPPGARIVDVGCGTGASVTYLREKHRFRALGFDVSGGLFRNAGSANTIPVALARAEELPLPDNSCDGVLCECVLSLVKEPRQTVGEFLRVLRPGGFLILSDIYDRSADNVDQNESTRSGPSTSALQSRPFVEKLLGDSGFTLRAWEDHTRCLKELVAQLILSSESLTEFHDLCGVFESKCTSPSGSPPVQPGYYLLVAQKMTKGDAFNG